MRSWSSAAYSIPVGPPPTMAKWRSLRRVSSAAKVVRFGFSIVVHVVP